jgi:methionyl-tRNA synthetase
VRAQIAAHMEGFATNRALAALWELIGAANKYLDSEAPWKLARDPDARPHLGTVIYEVLELLRVTAVLLGPFMPETSPRILDRLGCASGPHALAQAVGWGGLEPGTATRKGEALFPRIESA